MTTKNTFQVHESIVSEFEYMLKLLNQSDHYIKFDTVQDLINYILSSIADGSRRPGSWERMMLESMGIVSESPEHHVYRQNYGEPH